MTRPDWTQLATQYGEQGGAAYSQEWRVSKRSAQQRPARCPECDPTLPRQPGVLVRCIACAARAGGISQTKIEEKRVDKWG